MDEEQVDSQMQEEPTTTEQSPVEEQQETQEEIQETEEVQEEETQQEPEETEELSPRQQKRVEQISELKLNKVLSRVTGGRTPKPQGYKPLDYQEAIEADPEVVKQLAEDRERYASYQQAEALAQVQSVQFHTRLELDAPKVAQKFPIFDKENPETFQPAVADSINRMYLNFVGYDPKTGTVTNPDIRYSEFVEGIMELSEKTATNKVVSSQKNIARQAAQTGLRPSGAASKAKPLASPEDIAAIDQNDWEKNRDSYLKQLGIKKV